MTNPNTHKYILLSPLFLCTLAMPMLINCTSAKPTKARTSCLGDLFTDAKGTGKSISEARDKAKANIASDISSQVKSKTEMGDVSKETDGVFDESSIYLTASQIESNFTLLGFREMEPSRQIEDSLYEYKGYVCNSDAAKPFLDSLRNYKDALEALRSKKDACSKASEARKKMRGFETILEVLKQADKSLQKEYDNVYDEIKNDCNLEASKKLHWNPEKQTAYSDIAFSKLSANMPIETSPCKGKGISLIYKRAEPECKSNGGPYGCSYQPALLIASCNGTKLLLLESSAPVKSFDWEKENAVKNLQDKLKTEDFWNKWEQEIKQRGSQ